MKTSGQHGHSGRRKLVLRHFNHTVLSLLLTLGAVIEGNAAEIDSYARRQHPPQDAMPALNRWFNQRVQQGVDRANARAPGQCSDEALYRSVQEAFAHPFVGHTIAEQLNDSADIPHYRIHLQASVYRDLTVIDAVSMHWKDLSAVMNAHGAFIGTDKLGHFLVEGWAYFERAYLRGGSIDEAAGWGAFTERTYFGLLTTGIYSHADLAANLDGMRFWVRLLGRAPDPLDTGFFRKPPYVKCAKRFWSGKPYWKLAHHVKLEEFINPGWDEAVNCDDYRNRRIAILVNRRILERAQADDAPAVCPIDPGACRRAAAHYGDLRDLVLHRRCLDAIPPSRLWWKLW